MKHKKILTETLVSYFLFSNVFGQKTGKLINGKYFGPRKETEIVFPKDISTDSIEIGWFNQTLDHFNILDERKWEQKYARNATFFKENGPACIFIGGEGPMDVRWVVAGEAVIHCASLKGVIYALEHRFYGESRPMKNSKVESLKFLSINQALHDLMRFLQFVKNNETLKIGKVILYGGSYSGTLVTYFRQNFPIFADVAVASSAPISWKFDFTEYLESVGKVMMHNGEECYNRIESGMKKLESIISSFIANGESAGGPINPKLKPLKFCKDFYANETLDVEKFYSDLSGLFAYYTQYNRINSHMTIFDVCNQIVSRQRSNSTLTDYEVFADLVNIMNDKISQECFDTSFQNLCDYMGKTEWDEDATAYGGRIWNWQVCNEVASFQTTNSERQPFRGLSTHFFVAQCQCTFGEQYTEKFIRNAVDKHMRFYGGYYTKRTKVIYTNGEHDPWASLGIINDQQIIPQPLSQPNDFTGQSTNCIVYITGGASHCNDLMPEHPTTDTPELKEARKKVFNCVKNWVN